MSNKTTTQPIKSNYAFLSEYDYEDAHNLNALLSDVIYEEIENGDSSLKEELTERFNLIEDASQRYRDEEITHAEWARILSEQYDFLEDNVKFDASDYTEDIRCGDRLQSFLYRVSRFKFDDETIKLVTKDLQRFMLANIEDGEIKALYEEFQRWSKDLNNDEKVCAIVNICNTLYDLESLDYNKLPQRGELKDIYTAMKVFVKFRCHIEEGGTYKLTA